MKKILFGITSLTLGGAERVLVDLANRIKDDYAVSILTVYANGDLESQLDKSIEVKSIFPKRFDEYSKLEVFKNSRQLMKKEKLPEGYDLYISFLEGPMTRLFAKDNNTDAKKIVWVHNDISRVFGKGYKAKMKLLHKLGVLQSFYQIIQYQLNRIPCVQLYVFKSFFALIGVGVRKESISALSENRFIQERIAIIKQPVSHQNFWITAKFAELFAEQIINSEVTAG